MKVVKTESLFGTSREVNCPKGEFTSLRVLLKEDGMGYTMTRTIIPKGGPYFWHYKKHLESCFCVKGSGKVKDLTSNEIFDINVGDVYILDKNDPHEFVALEDVELICIFNPPLVGKEVHKEDGSY